MTLFILLFACLFFTCKFIAGLITMIDSIGHAVSSSFRPYLILGSIFDHSVVQSSVSNLA